MRSDSTGIPKPAIVLAIVLGAALLITVLVLRLSAPGEQPRAERNANQPLAVVPVPAPRADSQECAAVLKKLPKQLRSNGKQLNRLRLAKPAPRATIAWAAGNDPVILRCGLEKPAELKPTSELTEVSGVRWLRVADQGRSTYYAVDRPAYLAITVPDSVGTGPLQDASNAVRATLPEQPVRP